MEEDNYYVNVKLVLETGGHSDSQFPDKTCTIEFDATDVHMDVVLDQFKDFLSLMGYVVDNRRLEAVVDE